MLYKIKYVLAYISFSFKKSGKTAYLPTDKLTENINPKPYKLQFSIPSMNEKEEIRKEAKQILDKFAKALEKVEKEGKEAKEAGKESGMREEREGEEPDSDFREIMFENAPRKSKDFILAEKGDWK